MQANAGAQRILAIHNGPAGLLSTVLTPVYDTKMRDSGVCSFKSTTRTLIQVQVFLSMGEQGLLKATLLLKSIH